MQLNAIEFFEIVSVYQCNDGRLLYGDTFGSTLPYAMLRGLMRKSMRTHQLAFLSLSIYLCLSFALKRISESADFCNSNDYSHKPLENVWMSMLQHTSQFIIYCSQTGRRLHVPALCTIVGIQLAQFLIYAELCVALQAGNQYIVASIRAHRTHKHVSIHSSSRTDSRNCSRTCSSIAECIVGCARWERLNVKTLNAEFLSAMDSNTKHTGQSKHTHTCTCADWRRGIRFWMGLSGDIKLVVVVVDDVVVCENIANKLVSI